MTKHQIEIAFDTPEAEQFVTWLNTQGHSARIGNTTANVVDGQSTFDSENTEANQIMDDLWTAYCNA